jgi:hypothetical protein
MSHFFGDENAYGLHALRKHPQVIEQADIVHRIVFSGHH